mgnify:CR=1 FL=1
MSKLIAICESLARLYNIGARANLVRVVCDSTQGTKEWKG